MDDSRISLMSEQETSAFAELLAPHLVAGDTILLGGPIGAGKTLFARALIQARLRAAGRMEDVPSPTFTLVQTYSDGELEIWHADLYRLHGPDDIVELGLDEAFDTAICLVEWPDKLGNLAPSNALTLTFEVGSGDTQREILAQGSKTWLERLADVRGMTFAD